MCPARTRDAAVVGDAFDVDQVLDGNRAAVQRTARPALAQLFVEHARLLHGLGLEDRDERVERWVQLRDALERVARRCFATSRAVS